MATWQEINQDIQTRGFDIVRREKLEKLSELSGRPTVVYAVEMFNSQKIISAGGEQSISVALSDVTGFTDVISSVNEEAIDVILHSPGGSPEATESIVNMFRRKYKNIRFIVPLVAKSAATMMAMAGDEIILGDNGELGPTDPQMVINGKASPAHAILRQFKEAKTELSKSNSSLPAWLPILEQYGPSLIAQCNDAINLSRALVQDWLKKYMLAGDRRKGQKASNIARYLASNHLSHGRAITVEELQAKGVKIKRASEISTEFSDALEDLYTTYQQTFLLSGVIKIFENSNGQALINQVVILPSPQPNMQMPIQLEPPR
jgi:ATP-dependent protease ClpP protease subunit